MTVSPSNSVSPTFKILKSPLALRAWALPLIEVTVAIASSIISITLLIFYKLAVRSD
jgi:hypothetical protein